MAAALPEDLLIEIFSLLPLPDLLTVASVCTSWHDALRAPSHLWAVVDLTDRRRSPGGVGLESRKRRAGAADLADPTSTSDEEDDGGGTSSDSTPVPSGAFTAALAAARRRALESWLRSRVAGVRDLTLPEARCSLGRAAAGQAPRLARLTLDLTAVRPARADRALRAAASLPALSSLTLRGLPEGCALPAGLWRLSTLTSVSLDFRSAGGRSSSGAGVRVPAALARLTNLRRLAVLTGPGAASLSFEPGAFTGLPLADLTLLGRPPAVGGAGAAADAEEEAEEDGAHRQRRPALLRRVDLRPRAGQGGWLPPDTVPALARTLTRLEIGFLPPPDHDGRRGGLDLASLLPPGVAGLACLKSLVVAGLGGGGPAAPGLDLGAAWAARGPLPLPPHHAAFPLPPLASLDLRGCGGGGGHHPLRLALTILGGPSLAHLTRLNLLGVPLPRLPLSELAAGAPFLVSLWMGGSAAHAAPPPHRRRPASSVASLWQEAADAAEAMPVLDVSCLGALPPPSTSTSSSPSSLPRLPYLSELLFEGVSLYTGDDPGRTWAGAALAVLPALRRIHWRAGPGCPLGLSPLAAAGGPDAALHGLGPAAARLLGRGVSGSDGGPPLLCECNHPARCRRPLVAAGARAGSPGWSGWSPAAAPCPGLSGFLAGRAPGEEEREERVTVGAAASPSGSRRSAGTAVSW